MLFARGLEDALFPSFCALPPRDLEGFGEHGFCVGTGGAQVQGADAMVFSFGVAFAGCFNDCFRFVDERQGFVGMAVSNEAVGGFEREKA